MLLTRPVGERSASANFTKNSCRSAESALPPLSAVSTCRGGRPAARTSAAASASAAKPQPTSTWFTDFTS
jgi:hypothetical protein